MRLVLFDGKDKKLRDVTVPDEFAEFVAMEYDRVNDYIGRILTMRGLEGIRHDRQALQAELRDESARRRVEMPGIPDPRRKQPVSSSRQTTTFACRYCPKGFDSEQGRDHHEEAKHGAVPTRRPRTDST